jgi:hypothetical protein
MATDKVRVQAYLDPELAALVAETAKALGQSSSSLVAEMVENSRPVLEVLRDFATSLSTAPERHREALAVFAAAMRPLVVESNKALGDLQRPPSL